MEPEYTVKNETAALCCLTCGREILLEGKTKQYRDYAVFTPNDETQRVCTDCREIV